MKTLFIVFAFLGLVQGNIAQEKCELTMSPDTMTLPGSQAPMQGESLETIFKNLAHVKLFKAADGKLFLRLIVTENFYFNKTDVLEIKSGSKSFYARNAKQHKLNKSQGMFVFEIYKNYVYTLRDDGITGIVFAGAETDYTKQDAMQVKKIAACLYESLPKK